MYKYIPVAAFLFLFTGCQEPEEDLNKLIANKVWIETSGQKQYYFTDDGKRYLWMNAGNYGEFSPAEGTPATNKYIPSPKGWMLLGSYRVANDSLTIQSKKDPTGENAFTMAIERREDTLIGAVDYYVLDAKPATRYISPK